MSMIFHFSTRDLISRFELCQFDEMFNVFNRYNIKFNKTFCVDYFVRSLPASTLAAQSHGLCVNNVGNLQNLVFYVWFCSLIVVLFLTVCAWSAKRCHYAYYPEHLSTAL